MTRSPSIAGLILAAGASSRMGTDKALLPWRGGTFLQAQIEALRMVTEMVIVVAGANAESLKPIVYASGAFLVTNPQPELGQFSSLQVGVQAVLNYGRDAAMITLVDRPPVQPSTIDTLRTAFLRALETGKWAVVPETQGKHGHPILVAREMMEAFLRAPATSNAREVQHANQDRIEYVPVVDPHAVINVDTPEDYRRLTGTPA